MSFVTILKHSPKHMSAAAALRRGARLRRARGAEVLEAALVLSLIVFPLVCGMVEYGYYFHLQHTLTSASRNSGRRLAGWPQGLRGFLATVGRSSVNSPGTLPILVISVSSCTLGPVSLGPSTSMVWTPI